MKILIIEDEKELANSMASYLKGESYVCEFAATFKDAIAKTAIYEYDCILLDLMLPDGDGLKILESLKLDNKQDGVIIISAKDAIEDKITGLKLGADDYLPKPFHLSELSARIYSIIRRKQFGNANKIQVNELQVDLLAKVASVNNHLVQLTKKEFDLLLFLLGNKNRTISKAALAEHLSGDMADMLDNYDFVYAHIKNLKKKLADAGCTDYIKTAYGMGYKWEA
jgi:DNA-binding response OmpR family regulator